MMTLTLKPRSLKTVMLYSFSGVFLLGMFLFAFFTANIISGHITSNAEVLLNRSITIAWQEYNRFFDEERRILQLVAATRETKEIFGGREKSGEWLAGNWGPEDFRLAIDRQGNIVASNFQNGSSVPPEMPGLLSPAWREGKAIGTSEVLALNGYGAAFSSQLLEKSMIKTGGEAGGGGMFPYVLAQLAAVPAFGQDGALLGCLASGRLLNNDQTVHTAYKKLVPESFLVIAAKGVRVSTNIPADAAYGLVGSEQPAALWQSVDAGKRYIGQTRPTADETHFVVADPLLSGKSGEVIGSLTIGIPEQGITNIKYYVFAVLLLSLCFCLCVAFFVATAISRRISRTISVLSNVANEISHAEAISQEHLDKLDSPPLYGFAEAYRLHGYFRRMTTKLFQKNLILSDYIEELNHDKKSLHRLTAELQEANNLLENKVGERTLELRSAIDELKELNSLKTKFLANISHELRTPLHSIIGFSEMLFDELYGELNATQKEYVEIVLKSAGHLLEIINDSLDINNIEQGQIVLCRKNVLASELVASASAILKIQADGKGVAFRCRSEDVEIYVDPLRIKQVLYNIISNAIKFTPPGGEIEVMAAKEGMDLKITVDDTGIGIKEEDQKYVFDEFYQCGELYRRKFEGAGLGLPLSKKLVALHGGVIELSSKLKKGTTVTVILPLPKNSYVA
jgi:signal transduction histidine kinase